MNEIEISVVAPCYNEQGNIDLLSVRVAEALTPLGVGFELICVDDGSTDGTKAAIEQAMKKHPHLVGAFHEKNQGIVGGWKTGLDVSRGKYVVTIDADLQYRPEDIVAMYEKIQTTDADMVQGWRQTQVKRSLVRRFFTAGFSGGLNFVFGMNLKDNKSGYILYKREVLADVLEDRAHYKYFQHFITIAATARRYKIVQVPVTFDERFSGESFIESPLMFSIEAAMDIPRALWEYRINRRKKAVKG